VLKLRPILLVILLFAVSTMWVPEAWALSALEASIYLCAAATAGMIAAGRRRVSAGLFLAPFAAMCVWGIVQLAASWSVVRSATLQAVLYWLAAACLVWLGWEASRTPAGRLSFLRAALVAGSVVCLLGLVQLFTSKGRVFWLFPSGYETEVIGPFVSRNNYAAFVQLLLPLALALSFQDRKYSKSYLVLAAALFASVMASGSRTGAILIVIETAAVFVLCARLPGRGESHRRLALLSFGVPAAIFTAVCGYQFLWDRFSGDPDPY
jgi:hypothetical protein